MAFNGNLLSVGSYHITGKKYIATESYKCYRNVQDLDSYRDANGLLHRTALEHVPVKVEVKTVDGLKSSEMQEFLKGIRDNFSMPLERKASVTAYCPETDEYITQDMYMTQPELTIKIIKDGVVYYKELTIKFIGY